MTEPSLEIVLESAGAYVAAVEFAVSGPNATLIDAARTASYPPDDDPVWLRIVASPRKLCMENDFMPAS